MRASAAEAPTAAAQEIKRDILNLAGSKYGHDLDQVRRTRIEELAKQLAALGRDTPTVAAGQTWRPVYTNSKGTSSGKINIGPLSVVTDVEQLFPADEPGVYYNSSRLGLVQAKLKGVYEVSPSSSKRVNLEFKHLALKVGPFQLANKEWQPGEMRGYWEVLYWDDDFRAFTTNLGSLTILALDKN